MGRKARDSASTPAIQALIAAGVEHRLHPYEVSEEAPTYGEAVAASLGVEPDRLFKTLVAVVDGDPIVAIVPVSRTLAPKALAKVAGGKKAEMAKPEAAERWTGYVTGGISPFGQRRRLPTFIDGTVTEHDTVFVSAGRRGLQVEVAPDVLVDLLDAGLADLT